jgi:hypothetical protein
VSAELLAHEEARQAIAARRAAGDWSPRLGPGEWSPHDTFTSPLEFLWVGPRTISVGRAEAYGLLAFDHMTGKYRRCHASEAAEVRALECALGVA